ncbi:MAG: hypothetical protein HUJ30_02735 [Gammaproteobacteria bacterium]|nr:hypothetical protein [Gammaproteobacteria bacterium]
MKRLTEHQIKEAGLRFDEWEAGLFRWLWNDDGEPIRFFHSGDCYEKWKQKESPSVPTCSTLELKINNIRDIAQSWRERAKSLESNSGWDHALAVSTALEDCAEQIEILIGC